MLFEEYKTEFLHRKDPEKIKTEVERNQKIKKTAL